MPELYPLLLIPNFDERPWGVRDLRPVYTKVVKEPIGESWLTWEKNVVANGPLNGRTLGDVAQQYRRELVGTVAPYEDRFPLLVKFLFTADKLSVQVHPDDEAARRVGEPFGKTECWYVLDAQPGAQVALGLKPGVSLEEFKRAISGVQAEQLLNWIDVRRGRHALRGRWHGPHDRRWPGLARDAAGFRRNLSVVRLWPPARIAHRRRHGGHQAEQRCRKGAAGRFTLSGALAVLPGRATSIAERAFRRCDARLAAYHRRGGRCWRAGVRRVWSRSALRVAMLSWCLPACQNILCVRSGSWRSCACRFRRTRCRSRRRQWILRLREADRLFFEGARLQACCKS